MKVNENTLVHKNKRVKRLRKANLRKREKESRRKVEEHQKV